VRLSFSASGWEAGNRKVSDLSRYGQSGLNVVGVIGRQEMSEGVKFDMATFVVL